MKKSTAHRAQIFHLGRATEGFSTIPQRSSQQQAFQKYFYSKSCCEDPWSVKIPIALRCIHGAGGNPQSPVFPQFPKYLCTLYLGKKRVQYASGLSLRGKAK